MRKKNFSVVEKIIKVKKHRFTFLRDIKMSQERKKHEIRECTGNAIIELNYS